MDKTHLRVGDTTEVIEVVYVSGWMLAEPPYKIGNFGTIIQDQRLFNNNGKFMGSECYIGSTNSIQGHWYLTGSEMRKVGKLTITKVK